MKTFLSFIALKSLLLILTCIKLTHSVTMEQFEQSLDMMRNGCAPKFKVNTDQLDALRNGYFDESNAELKVTKKGELSISKAIAQIPIILPAEIQENAKAALNSCKDVQKDYKDSCDRIFYVTKCVRDFSPEDFKFP